MQVTSSGTASGPAAEGMSSKEILRLVNRYIGVTGGYLGDFSYRTHRDFYPEFCDLDVDPDKYQGTTRERFIAILSDLRPREQAKVLRGVLARFPVGEGPATRTQSTHDEVVRIAERLEGGLLVPSHLPRIASEVVNRALEDAEQLLAKMGAVSAVDRVHTALHGYLLAVCNGEAIAYPTEPSMTALFRLLRQTHPKLRNLGPRSQDIEKVLNASAAILDAMNPVRNKASVAHPNAALLAEDEARLVINAARTLLAYLDAKLA
jgi:abortive infection Abi-like protein